MELFSEEQIRERVKEAAREMERDFSSEVPVIVGVLKGAFIFTADLVRNIKTPVEVDFIRVASYGKGTESSGSIRVIKDIETEIRGRDVVVVEDILDSGLTLGFLRDWLGAKRPRSLRFCVLLDKRSRRQRPFVADYVCFSLDDGFVVGYGLDHGERYRNLPSIQMIDGEENE